MHLESNEDRAARLATLSENQSKRLQSESNEDCAARLATLSENQRKRLQSESTKKRESRLSRSKKWKKTRLINESKQKRTLRLEREKEQARLRMQAWRRQKRFLQVKCNSEAEITSSVPCTNIVSNTKVNVTGISSIYESTDGLESDSLKEVQKESIQSDDSVMDDNAKENLISQMSEDVDMEVGGRVVESGDVTASAVQVPRLEISIPSKQGLKLKNNLYKFKKAILKGPTHKCFLCERLCYEQLGALYSCDVANDLRTVVNESVQESIESVWLCNKCKSAMERKKIPAGSQFNKMKVPEVPSVFIGLNTLEQCLISKATVLMKMVILPRGGQRAVRGQVINFPSNVDCVISEW